MATNTATKNSPTGALMMRAIQLGKKLYPDERMSVEMEFTQSGSVVTFIVRLKSSEYELPPTLPQFPVPYAHQQWQPPRPRLPRRNETYPWFLTATSINELDKALWQFIEQLDNKVQERAAELRRELGSLEG